VISVADPNFSIPDHGSRIQGQKRFQILDPVPDPRIYVFPTQKIVSNLSEIWSEMFIPEIPDPDLDF
jgi:hypothetical protein